ICAAGRRVGADIGGVQQVAKVHVGQLLCEADGVECVTCRAKNGTELGGTLLEAPHRVLTVIEDHAAERLIDAIVDVITELSTTHGFPNDLADGGRSRGHEKPSGFGEDLDRWGKESIEFRVDRMREVFECGDRIVVVRGEPSADVEQLELETASS